ncbi:MAG: PASTA domain-containing protein [Ignavibacteria bacterium]|nr:PASTA domain-containing protein [Ignavibacteria bacterium]
MPPDYKKILTSNRSRKIFLYLGVILLLFFLCNDLVIPWYVNHGGVLTVPSVVGVNFDLAKRILDSLGLEGRQADVRLDREHPAGEVIIQNPMAGDKVKKGRRIYLTVSGGELLVTVPNVKGRTLRDARFGLEREGLKLGAVEYQSSEEFPTNTIIEQKIAPGTKVKKDVYVSVIVSQGSVSQSIIVPDVTGKTLTQAGIILSGSGLRSGNVTYIPSADLLPNTVVDQYPRGGERVINGQAVDLFVVQGAEKKKEILEN